MYLIASLSSVEAPLEGGESELGVIRRAKKDGKEGRAGARLFSLFPFQSFPFPSLQRKEASAEERVY